MDGGLWNVVYRTVRLVARSWPATPQRRGRGRPDTYEPWEIALIWLWTAFWDQPLVATVEQLASQKFRTAMKLLGLKLPPRLPHETTIRRRSLRQDYAAFIDAVDRQLQRVIGAHCSRLLVDSTPLAVSPVSKDPDATWGHHNLHGYRLHTLTSSNRVVLQERVEPANVHELKVAPVLMEAGGKQGLRPRFVVGDLGYDSEPLHQSAKMHLRAQLVAPLNDRGGRRAMRATPLRAWLNAHWNDPRIQGAMKIRPEIDRMYSVLKSHRFGLWALPPWVRHLPSVRRWVRLKMVLYHGYLADRRSKRAA